MATVNIISVNKLYNTQSILEDINLNIEKGEFIAVVGPSGCGKSTLLRLVSGLDVVSSGSILINNQCVNKMPPASRDMAMVFQSYALYPHMTVYENMAYGLRMRGMKKNLVKQRVDEVAQLLQLKDFLYKKPGLLSGGQRQRVAMGRAIVRSPAVFLFDEPLSNLDAKLRTEMRHEIKKLHQKLNTTCLYVTHDQTEAMTLADRVVVLNKGRIEQIGTPRELYDQPATLFVASFIGHYPMNFISGEMDTKNQVFVSDTGCVHPLPRLDNTLLADDQVSLGFRSEHLRIVPQPGPNSISGNIEFVDDMGADKLVQLVTDDGNLRLSVRIPGDQPINGPSINVAIEMQYINVFSHSTGRRLNDTIN